MKFHSLRLAMVFFLALVFSSAAAREYFVYFGTYTGAKSKGIYVSRFDDTTGKLSPTSLAAETKSPSFLALHPNGKFLFAVGESAVGTNGQGAVSAFTVDHGNGKLTLLNSQPSGGGGPCHLALDVKRRHVLVANYGTGSIAALPFGEDGRLDEPSCVIQHNGSSVNPQRQAGPHAHCVVLDPSAQLVLACDLGMDKVMVYELGGNSRTLTLTPSVARYELEPGAGPRHLAFSADGKFIYVVNEMGSSITAFVWNRAADKPREVQTISTLPDGFTNKTTCAEIAAHPSGKFVYASNRGHDSIAVFAADSKTGKLSPVQHAPTLGKTPRHFAIDPSGRWLLAENQASDSIVVFRVNKKSGQLEPTGDKLEVPSPVCAVFLGAR